LVALWAYELLLQRLYQYHQCRDSHRNRCAVSKPDAGAPGDLYDRYGFSVSANLGAALQSLKASEHETAHNA